MRKSTPMLGLLAAIWVTPCTPAEQVQASRKNPNERLVKTPWSVMAYRGWTSTKSLGQTIQGKYEYAGEDMYSAELAYTLAPENSVSRFFSHIGARFQLAGNFAVRRDNGDTIEEWDAYFMVRWYKLPWNRYVPTTLAIGQGLSWVSQVPSVEEDDEDDTKRLLNFLTLEATFALPSRPEIQLVGRIHHRSGVFGLFGSENSASNVVGVGLRYFFSGF